MSLKNRFIIQGRKYVPYVFLIFWLTYTDWMAVALTRYEAFRLKGQDKDDAVTFFDKYSDMTLLG